MVLPVREMEHHSDIVLMRGDNIFSLRLFLTPCLTVALMQQVGLEIIFTSKA